MKPAQQFLSLIEKRIDQARADVPKLISLAERMAEPLLAGGALFTPDIGVYWPSEFGGRAGGFMGLKPSNYVPRSSNDVAWTTLPDARNWRPRDDAKWQRLIDSKAQIFVVGHEGEISGDRIAGFTGGAAAGEGFYGDYAPLRPF